jgi:hypothetical protein
MRVTRTGHEIDDHTQIICEMDLRITGIMKAFIIECGLFSWKYRCSDSHGIVKRTTISEGN